jgi:hypothetical protein
MSERNNSGELQVPQFMYDTQRRTNEKNFRESLKYIPDQQSNSHRYSDVNHSVRRTKEARNRCSLAGLPGANKFKIIITTANIKAKK